MYKCEISARSPSFTEAYYRSANTRATESSKAEYRTGDTKLLGLENELKLACCEAVDASTTTWMYFSVRLNVVRAARERGIRLHLWRRMR